VTGIREIARLRKRYGRGQWRKRNGMAEIRLASGEVVATELHWYAATGIGCARGETRSAAGEGRIGGGLPLPTGSIHPGGTQPGGAPRGAPGRLSAVQGQRPSAPKSESLPRRTQ
jgi:hypothetical protein